MLFPKYWIEGRARGPRGPCARVHAHAEAHTPARYKGAQGCHAGLRGQGPIWYHVTYEQYDYYVYYVY